MKTVAIVQARLGSSRLPCKTLLPLPSGRVVVEEVLHRCRQIEGVDQVVCAVPWSDQHILQPFVDRVGGVILVTGSETDVLSRYRVAAEEVEADVILRVTADCPLLNPAVCVDLLGLRARTGFGYVSNAYPSRHFPHGWDCEAFTMETLLLADREATDPHDREHAGCPFMQRHPDVARAYLKSIKDNSHLRWTLDDIHDYRRIWRVMEEGVEAVAA